MSGRHGNTPPPAKLVPGGSVIDSLTGNVKVEMLQLIRRFNAQQIPLPEFLATAKSILGIKLYTEWINSNQVGKLSAGVSEERTAIPTVQPIGMKAIMRPPSLSSPRPPLAYAEDMPLEELKGRAGSVESSASPAQANRPEGGPDAFQDILQYSGVNLMEEAENILKEQDYLLASVASLSGEDYRSRSNYLFNVDLLQKVIYAKVMGHGLHGALETCSHSSIMDLLLTGVMIRIANILDEVVVVSRHRVDTLRSHFKMKIENDAKYQMEVLEMVIRNKNVWRYPRKETDVTMSSEDAELPAEKKSKQEASAASVSSPATTSASAVAPSKMPPSMSRDGDMVRARITNATAMGQLGTSSLKSWMMPGAAKAAPSLSSPIPNPSPAYPSPAVNISPPASPSSYPSHPSHPHHTPFHPGSVPGHPSPFSPMTAQMLSGKVYPMKGSPLAPMGSSPLPPPPQHVPIRPAAHPSSSSAVASSSPSANMSPFAHQHHHHYSPSPLPPQPTAAPPYLYGVYDREWRSSVKQRQVTLRDLIFCMRMDRHLSHSPILSHATTLFKQ